MHIKKLILLLFLVPVLAQAQKTTGPNYTYIAQRYEWLAGVFKALGIPAGDSAQFQTGQEMRAGALYYDSVGVDSGLYVWSGLAWNVAGTSYTDADARAAISLTTTGTSGAATYDNGTGVFNIPVYAGTLNANAGAFYRWLIPSTQEIKTFVAKAALTIDSATNTDALTISITDFEDPRDYGAIGNGSTNDATAMASTITASASSGKPIFIAPGKNYRIDGTAGATPLLALGENQRIFGLGPTSIISTTSNARILRVGYNGEVAGIKFVGSGSKASGLEYQSGVYAGGTTATGWVIHNCIFENLGGSAFINGGAITIEQITTAATEGGRIINNRFNNCNYGIVVKTRAEYVSIIGNKADSCNVGYYVRAGNVSGSGNNAGFCNVGFDLVGGTNDGHAGMYASTFNHNTINIRATDVTNGYIFQVAAHAGNIEITNSNGIRFVSGSDISTGTATLTNSNNLYRTGKWLTMVTNVVSGEDFSAEENIRTTANTPVVRTEHVNADTTIWKDALYHTGNTPASGSNSDSVWVKDASTNQFKLRAQSDIGTPGSGTVTSVATTDATGIKGGTITTTGTLFIDTLIISTRAWRDKLADSLGALIGAGGISLAAIGSTPNANGATLTGTALNLEPASASFGGVVTTGTQTIAGVKTITSSPIFSAGLQTNATAVNSNLYVPSSNGAVSSSSATYTVLGSATTAFRVGMGGSTSTTLGNNMAYANLTVGGSPISETATGSMPLAAGQIIKTFTITNGAGATADIAGLYIEGPATGVTPTGKSYGIWSDAGVNRFDGVFNVGGTDLTANQIWGANSGATAMEGKTLTNGQNIKVTHGAGTATFAGATLTKNAMVENPTASENLFMFRTPVAITVTDVTAVLVGGTPSVTYNIAFGTDRTTGTNVYTAGQTVTSETTGTAASGVNDATIPAGSWVWVTTSAATDVTQLNISLTYTED